MKIYNVHEPEINKDHTDNLIKICKTTKFPVMELS